MNQEIEQLKKDIQEFKTFRESLDNKQLTFPLDKKSVDVVQKDVLVPTGITIVPYGLATYDTNIEISINDRRYIVNPSQPY